MVAFIPLRSSSAIEFLRDMIPCLIRRSPGATSATQAAPFYPVRRRERTRPPGGPILSKITAALVVLFSIALSSCDLLGDDDPEYDTSVLMPLAVGNYWAYSSWYLEPSLSDSFTVEITREVPVTLGGESFSAFAWAYRYGGLLDPHAFLYANRDGGLYNVGGIASTDTLLQKSLAWKYPGEPGDTWQTVRLAYSRDTGTFYEQDTVAATLISTDEPFETPLGTFRCYVYKFSFKPADDVVSYWNVYRYYAPGIGNVGEVIKSQAPGEPEDKDITAQAVLYDYRVR